MDWQLAIHRNTEALTRIITALFVLGGFAEGRTVLPAQVYRSILRVLRPAESAVRRLIMLVAFGLKVTLRPARPFPARIAAGAVQTKLPAFRLIDPLKRFSPSVTLVGGSYHNNFWTEDLIEDENTSKGYKQKQSIPRISLPGQFDPIFAPPLTSCDKDFINAEHLVRRLCALKRALENLPREARRLARWHARRDLIRKQFPQRTGRLSPCRPGLPPGYRLAHKHEIDSILRECHGLVKDRLEMPNTS
jgi:hypothetical protein